MIGLGEHMEVLEEALQEALQVLQHAVLPQKARKSH
jgi:hypothetical protein